METNVFGKGISAMATWSVEVTTVRGDWDLKPQLEPVSSQSPWAFMLNNNNGGPESGREVSLLLPPYRVIPLPSLKVVEEKCLESHSRVTKQGKER